MITKEELEIRGFLRANMSGGYFLPYWKRPGDKDKQCDIWLDEKDQYSWFFEITGDDFNEGILCIKSLVELDSLLKQFETTYGFNRKIMMGHLKKMGFTLTEKEGYIIRTDFVTEIKIVGDNGAFSNKFKCTIKDLDKNRTRYVRSLGELMKFLEDNEVLDILEYKYKVDLWEK